MFKRSLVSLVLLASAAANAQSLGGKVTDAATSQPIAGARVSLVGTLQGTMTHADGSYRLPVAAGRQVVRVSYIGYSPVVDTVLIGGDGASRDYKLVKGGVQLDANVVIGTRLNDRTVLNAPVPVDVLTPAEIQQTGQIETNQVIQMLAPSFNFPRPSISDGTDHVRPSTLRGLGPDQVLVLVNGKRRYTSALVNVNGTIGRGSTGVDLNAIPSSAIERIEILRDGAAAQYGSDAIAGVINIILKTDPTTEVGGEIGSNYTKLDPKDTAYAANLAYLKDKTLTDGDVAEWDGNTGVNWSNGGFFHVTGQYEHRGSTNRSLPDLRTQYFSGDPKNTDPAYVGQNHFRQGDALVTDIGFLVNSNLPRFNNGSQVYFFGGASHRDGQGAGNWRLPNGTNTVREIWPNGFLPFINSAIVDYSGTAGIKGDISGWKYDLSGSYGSNRFDFTITNTNNATMPATTPKTEFDAGGLKFGQAVANLDFVRAFPISSFTSPLNVAFGAEARHDKYTVIAGEPDSYRDAGSRPTGCTPAPCPQPAPGAQVFSGFQPGDAGDNTRNNFAGYIDLETSLLQRLQLGLAGRTEHYSDFGSTTNGKASARLEFYPGYALRGAVQTGFRAPSLAQEFFSSTATNFLNLGSGLQPYEVRTLPATSNVAVALGAVPLKPEKSVNYSVGLALAPLQNLSITADYYHITIDDRIVLSGNFGGNADFANFLASKGITGVGLARFFTNAIDTKTAGLDVITRYAVDLGNLGITRFTGGGNWTKSHVTRISDTPNQLILKQAVLFDRIEQGRIEVGQPHRTIHLTLDHTKGPFAATIHTAQFGPVGFRGSTSDLTLDQTFSAKWVTDVNASYTFFRQLRLTLGANNVFDQYPDEQIVKNSNSRIFPYSTTLTTFGNNGRFIYARMKYTM
ncbi:MAG TPA: TonB-dependent receptor [Gemmatimonadaceae bacterium]|jgi:iron complex outermembrane receptor protein|nr:TonB-dependent receptor [Gemmatimonadaceae bacterium]